MRALLPGLVCCALLVAPAAAAGPRRCGDDVGGRAVPCDCGDDSITALAGNDANTCTADSCDPVFGCINEPVADGSACDDANPCTTRDACTDGFCAGGPPPDCDDGNVCTDDACDASTGCTHTPVVCPNDGNACNGAETCTPPVGCHHGTLVTCPAGQVCAPPHGQLRAQAVQRGCELQRR